MQLYPSNSISDFRLVENHERALIDTPAVWRCPQRVTQNFSSTNFNLHKNEAVGSISLDSIGEFKALWFSWDRSVSRLVPLDLLSLYIHSSGGGEWLPCNKDGMFGVNSKENLQKIPARSLRRLLHFFHS